MRYGGVCRSPRSALQGKPVRALQGLLGLLSRPQHEEGDRLEPDQAPSPESHQACVLLHHVLITFPFLSSRGVKQKTSMKSALALPDVRGSAHGNLEH